MIKNTKLLITMGLIILILLGANTLKNKKTIVYFNRNTEIKEEIEIISHNYYTRVLPNIREITKVSWLNDSKIEFYCNNKGEDLHLLFDIENRTLSNVEEKNNKGIDEGVLNFAKEIDNNRKIVYIGENSSSKEKGLFYIDDNLEIKLADSIEVEGETKVKFASDFSRIAFYDSVESVLKIYNTQNNSLKAIDFVLSDYILKHFNESLHFSYDNGYLILEHVDYEDINKSYFSVFGSDTGKLYGDKIYGIKPQWAKESLYISFIYSESDISIHKEDKFFQIAGGRLGVFNLKNRSIKYTESIDKPFRIIGNPLWSNKDNEVYIMIGKGEGNRYIPTSIYTFSIKNNTLIDLNYRLDKFFDNSNILMNKYDNWLFLADELEGKLVSIDLISRSMKFFEGLQEYNLNYLGEYHSNMYTFLFDNTFIFLKDDSIYYFDDNVVKNIYKLNSRIENIYLSPSKDKILITNDLETGIEFSIIDLNRGI